MSTTCYIIDHHDYSNNYFSQCIRDTPGLELIGIETNVMSGILNIIGGKVKPGITLLITGYSASTDQYIAVLGPLTEVIFIVIHYDINELKKINALYIECPAPYERFKAAIDKALERLASKNNS